MSSSGPTRSLHVSSLDLDGISPYGTLASPSGGDFLHASRPALNVSRAYDGPQANGLSGRPSAVRVAVPLQQTLVGGPGGVKKKSSYAFLPGQARGVIAQVPQAPQFAVRRNAPGESHFNNVSAFSRTPSRGELERQQQQRQRFVAAPVA